MADPNVVTLELRSGVFAIRLDEPVPQTCYTERPRDGRAGTSRSGFADWNALTAFAQAILAQRPSV